MWPIVYETGERYVSKHERRRIQNEQSKRSAGHSDNSYVIGQGANCCDAQAGCERDRKSKYADGRELDDVAHQYQKCVPDALKELDDGGPALGFNLSKRQAKKDGDNDERQQRPVGCRLEDVGGHKIDEPLPNRGIRSLSSLMHHGTLGERACNVLVEVEA